jgi:hypothetical protein
MFWLFFRDWYEITHGYDSFTSPTLKTKQSNITTENLRVYYFNSPPSDFYPNIVLPNLGIFLEGLRAYRPEIYWKEAVKAGLNELMVKGRVINEIILNTDFSIEVKNVKDSQFFKKREGKNKGQRKSNKKM